MAFSLSPTALARSSARHPWRTLVIWVAIFVISIGVVSNLLDSALTNEATTTKATDSKIGNDLLESKLRGQPHAHEAVSVTSSTLSVDDPAFKSFVDDIYRQISALGPDKVDSVVSYYSTQNPGFVSQDKRTTLLPITMAGDLDHASENIGEVLKIVEDSNGKNGFEVFISGQATVGEDFNKAAEKDIARGESIGGFIALVILIIVFGTGSKALAGEHSFFGKVWKRTTSATSLALAPIMLAVISIVAALAASALVGQQYQLSFFVSNMISMMGLAVGIDYSLFILSRFREEQDHGRSVLDSIDIASATSGRAVFFSGLTVIIALFGMLIVPSTIYRSLAAGAIFVVAFAILASISLLPALIRIFAEFASGFFHRPRVARVTNSVAFMPLKLVKNVALIIILSPFLLLFTILEAIGLRGGKQAATAPTAESHGFWDGVAKTVMKHPVVGVVVVSGILIAASVPYFDMNRGSAGISTLPDTFESKKGFRVLEEKFAGGQVYQADIVIDGEGNSSAVKSAVSKLQTTLGTDKTFGPSSYEVNKDGDLGVLSVQIATDPNKDEANAGIRRLRNDYIPNAFDSVDAKVYVTGQTAINVDSLDVTSGYTPIVFAFVLGLSFLLLMMVFRSIVVPAKAIIMNLLSVGAAYGLIVLVFQEGIGTSLLGFQRVETVEFWLPLFLFSVLFGLSMDYHVFLLSRIRERYDQTHDNTDAVAYGLRSTGRLITGAALIMVAVFGGFAMGDLVMLQQMGFGLGVAVLMDATIIRTILVPASMKLLGDLNWYLPPVLSWLPHFGVEEQFDAPPMSAVPEGAGGGS